MKEAMTAVIDATNSMTEREMAVGMLEALNGSHRTLQQTFFRVFVKTMNEYGSQYDKGIFDARNEAAAKFAKDISEMDTHFPFI